MKKYIFSLFYIVIPIIVEEIWFPKGILFSDGKPVASICGLHLVFSEISIAIWMLLKMIEEKKYQKSNIILVVAFFSIGIAESLYMVAIFQPQSFVLRALDLLFYTVFMFNILWFIKLKKVNISMVESFFIINLSVLFLFLDNRYIQSHFDHTYFFLDVRGYIINPTSLYTVCVSLILSFALVRILRENNFYNFLFLACLSFVCISDFGMRYQSILQTEPTNYEHIWQTSFSMLFIMIVIFKKHENLFAERNVSTIISVRTLLSIITLLLIFLLGFLLYFFRIIKIGDTFDAANLLITIYTIYNSSNILSLIVSNMILRIGISTQTHQKQFLDKNKFLKIEQRTMIYEIDSIIKYYNDLSDKSNEILKKLIEESKFATIGKMTSIIVHDIRSPINELKMMFDIDTRLLMRNPKVFDRLKNHIDLTLDNVSKSILSISTLTREPSLDVEPMSIIPIINDAVQQVGKQFKDIDIHIDYVLDAKSKPLVDAKHIVNVFYNILRNAIEAISEIGQRTYGQIWIKTKNKNNYYEIIIGNDGPHLSENFKENMFDYFATNSKQNGMGVGLAFVKKIIELHNGSIIGRNVEKGVEFVITLETSGEDEKKCLQNLPQSLVSFNNTNNLMGSIGVQ